MSTTSAGRFWPWRTSRTLNPVVVPTANAYNGIVAFSRYPIHFGSGHFSIIDFVMCSWTDQIWQAGQVNKGNVVRRSVQSVATYSSHKELKREVRRLRKPHSSAAKFETETSRVAVEY